jgi:hypothetical protein
VHQPDRRPVPAAPIDLAPVTPKLLGAWAEQPIDIDEHGESWGGGRPGFWFALALVVALLLPWPVFAVIAWGHEAARVVARLLELMP